MASSMSGSENKIDPAFIIVGALVLLLLSFNMFADFYIGIWVKIKLLELNAMKYIGFALTQESIDVIKYYLNALNTPNKVAMLTKDKILIVEGQLFSVYTWVYPAIFFMLGLKTLFYSKNKYNRPHTMESLLKQETKTLWRFNRHLIKYNPLEETTDITEGIYSIRQKEKRFCVENKIIYKVDIEDEYYSFDRTKALQLFSSQMGPRFMGLSSFQNEESWLLAAFLLYLNNKKTEAFDLLGDASFVYADEMDRASVNAKAKKIICQLSATSDYKALECQHAYVYTFLMRVFYEAKDMGEFSAAKFTWLKLYNRQLWFCLLDVGMSDGGSIEAAGPQTHFQAEKAYQKKKSEPQVMAYVDFLQNKMREYTEKRNTTST